MNRWMPDPPPDDDDEPSPSTWGITDYPAHVPMGLPLPATDDRPDEEYTL